MSKTAVRLHFTLDMHRYGAQVDPTRLHGLHPNATPERIQRLVQTWRHPQPV
ncbi:MAG: hypothetical protein HOQ24_17320 [Mycobacteriaceae bacterium]|nr:hypothetical protein [Mycobacteriaceae bacterium]